MKTRVRGGRWTFKAPLGYRNGRDASGKKTLLPDPDRAPYVAEAFKLYATGLHTKEQVRVRVNASGLRTHRGKPLSSETFDRLLRNPRYAGVLRVKGWDVESQGDYEPLITTELFGRVQDILAGRRVVITPRKRNNPDFPLRNFVSCGQCGKPLTASWSKGKMGVKYAYYRCQNHACVSPVNVRRQDLEAEFVEFLREQRPDPAYLRLFNKVVLDVWQERQTDATLLARKLQRQVDELKEQKRKLNEAFVYQQAISREDYQQMRTALNDNLAEAELNLGQARVDEIEIEDLLNFAENLLINTAEVWVRASLEQKQRLQQVVFPVGVEYGNGVYRTQDMGFLFKGLAGIKGAQERVGSATGNRTRV
jgi:site-specific DNA recombinase